MKVRYVVASIWASLASFALLVVFTASVALARANPAQSNKVVIHAGRLLDVKSGRWLADQNIFIEGDKVVRVESGGVQVSSDWKVIDLSSAVIRQNYDHVPSHLGSHQ